MPAVEQFLLRELEREVEVALLQGRVFDIGARAAEGRIGVAAAGQMQPLIEQVLLIKLGQVGQQLMRVMEVVVDVAIDQLDAVGGFAGPARRGDGRGAFLANVDLFELVGCLSHISPNL